MITKQNFDPTNLKGEAFEKCAFDWLRKTVGKRYPDDYNKITFRRLKKIAGKSGAEYTFDIVMERQGIFSRDDGRPDLRWLVECKCKKSIHTSDILAFIKESEDVGDSNMMLLYCGHLQKTPRKLLKHYNVTACDLSRQFLESSYYQEIKHLIEL